MGLIKVHGFEHHPETPEQITLTVFERASSLQQVEVQWSHDKGQGMAKLTPNKPELVWLE